MQQIFNFLIRNKNSILFLFLFAVSIFLYILVLEFGPDAKSSDLSLIFNVLTQKTIILIFMLLKPSIRLAFLDLKPG